MALELYLDLFSQPCRAVYIFAKANGIPFVFKEVALIQGQHKTEEYGKVNPMKKVPALKDGDFTLSESNAILRYLARKFKTPDHWYPSDLQKCARVDEYLSWQHTNTRKCNSKLYTAKALLPLLLGQPAPPERLEQLMKELNEILDLLEDKFLQDRAFVAGSDISLADLLAVVDFMQPLGAGYDVFEGRPKLAAWRSRVQQAVGKELFEEAHRELFRERDWKFDRLSPEEKEQLTQNMLKYVQ
uniref:glutathione transferase n=1 Tax=Salvator merianae TaxID=96440 RepID=A0A8D0AZ68_SALMN